MSGGRVSGNAGLQPPQLLASLVSATGRAKPRRGGTKRGTPAIQKGPQRTPHPPWVDLRSGDQTQELPPPLTPNPPLGVSPPSSRGDSAAAPSAGRSRPRSRLQLPAQRGVGGMHGCGWRIWRRRAQTNRGGRWEYLLFTRQRFGARRATSSVPPRPRDQPQVRPRCSPGAPEAAALTWSCASPAGFLAAAPSAGSRVRLDPAAAERKRGKKESLQVPRHPGKENNKEKKQ